MIFCLTLIKRIFFIGTFLLLACTTNASSAEQSNLMAELQALDEAYRDLSKRFYTLESIAIKTIIDDPDVLSAQVSELIDANDQSAAIKLLYAHKDLILDNFDHPALTQFVDLLLQQNEWHLADELREIILQQNDRALLSAIQFSFARYHAKRKEWPAVVNMLQENIAELSAEQQAQAYLLYGTALQHLKQHRKATAQYAKITPASPLFLYAQLNATIASIRQGWVSEAQGRVNEIIAQSLQQSDQELTQRLYLILGYALLQREYYRDARQAFGQINQQSRYANRALLGLGLAASSQGDYIGGLNALNSLKEKNEIDLSVDESYLIIPYIYEKIQRESIVSTSYSEAMNHYQQRIDNLNQLLTTDIRFSQVRFVQPDAALEVNDTRLAYGQHFPAYFMENYDRLEALKAGARSAQIAQEIDELSAAYESMLHRVVADLLALRIKQLQNYLNQSRFGLARLYDKLPERLN